MRLEFSITGTLTVPDGTTFLDGSDNIFRLPTGQLVSVHPTFEMESSEGADDHNDLNWSEACAVGVEMEDYDRTTDVLPED